MTDRYDAIATLERAGIAYADAVKLRSISLTLRRWHALECGTGDGQITRSIERDGDEPDSKPYLRTQYPMRNGGYHDSRYPIADKETGARKRLAAIMARYPALSYYVQGDPRGAALYILRPGDVPEGRRRCGGGRASRDRGAAGVHGLDLWPARGAARLSHVRRVGG